MITVSCKEQTSRKLYCLILINKPYPDIVVALSANTHRGVVGIYPYIVLGGQENVSCRAVSVFLQCCFTLHMFIISRIKLKGIRCKDYLIIWSSWRSCLHRSLSAHWTVTGCLHPLHQSESALFASALWTLATNGMTGSLRKFHGFGFYYYWRLM
jgi:hypothetical protein